MGNGERVAEDPPGQVRRVVVVGPGAQRDLDNAVLWCRGRFGPAAAKRLVQRFDEVVALLANHPGLGTISSNGTRQFTLQRFPFSLVYRASDEVVLLLALRHQRRMPGSHG